jgi:hypothetical protein
MKFLHEAVTQVIARGKAVCVAAFRNKSATGGCRRFSPSTNESYLDKCRYSRQGSSSPSRKGFCVQWR